MVLSIEQMLRHAQAELVVAEAEHFAAMDRWLTCSEERGRLIEAAYAQGKSREDIAKVLGVPLLKIDRITASPSKRGTIYRNGRVAREDIRRVDCPTCGAVAGDVCCDSDGTEREHNHMARMSLYTGRQC